MIEIIVPKEISVKLNAIRDKRKEMNERLREINEPRIETKRQRKTKNESDIIY